MAKSFDSICVLIKASLCVWKKTVNFSANILFDLRSKYGCRFHIGTNKLTKIKQAGNMSTASPLIGYVSKVVLDLTSNVARHSGIKTKNEQSINVTFHCDIKKLLLKPYKILIYFQI